MYKRFVKRGFDLLLALMLFVLLLPIYLMVYIHLSLKYSDPPIFTQRRPGLDGRIFKIKKFRTMNTEKDSDQNLLSDAERITPTGQFLRKYSLDEIPQLINVIAGDMSLVGPRPLLVEYLPLYSDFHRKRHEVKPGITGWAQINGRNAIEWETRLDLDVWYVEHVSFLLDLKIIMRTVLKIFDNEDVSSSTHATKEKFTGSKKQRL